MYQQCNLLVVLTQELVSESDHQESKFMIVDKKITILLLQEDYKVTEENCKCKIRTTKVMTRKFTRYDYRYMKMITTIL